MFFFNSNKWYPGCDIIHVLSYDAKNRQMEFVFLHKTELYLVAKTNGLDLIKDNLNQIVTKEILIKEDLAQIMEQDPSYPGLSSFPFMFKILTS